MISPPSKTPPLTALLDLDAEAIDALVAELGQPPYRARQIRKAVYTQAMLDFHTITELPQRLRDTLSARLRVAPAVITTEQTVTDGSTTKWLLRLDDGELVETVLMRYDPFGERRPRRTVCISTQAGCAMGCVFCATGAQGFRRQLRVGEILAQVLVAAACAAKEDAPLSNVVFMGMGEPLANYDATHAALTRLTAPDAFAMSPRRITVSTVGVLPGIRRLAVDHPQINLAISLHAPDDALRRRLVPISSASVREMVTAARAHVEATGRRVSIEYVLIAGINDAPDQARALARILHGINGHVNLIPLNLSPGVEGAMPDRRVTLRFQSVLEEHGVRATVRVEKGRDIAAACGQLRGDRVGKETG